MYQLSSPYLPPLSQLLLLSNRVLRLSLRFRKSLQIRRSLLLLYLISFNMRLYPLLQQVLLKLIYSIYNFSRLGINFGHCHVFDRLGLFVLKFECLPLPFFLDHHVFLPVLDSLSQPLLHESSVPLKPVNVGLSQVGLRVSRLTLILLSSSSCSC